MEQKDNIEKDSSQPAPASKSSSASALRYEEILMREAHEKKEKGQYQAAGAILEDVLRRCDNVLDKEQKSMILSELGLVYFWLGDLENARQKCDLAAQFIDNDESFSILGKIAVAKFQFPKARGYFSKIHERNPLKPLGMCLISIKLRDTVAVEAFLREAAALGGTADLEYRIYHAYHKLLKGDMDAAAMDVRSLALKCKDNPELMLLIAEIFMTAGNYGEAVSSAKKVEKNCPDNDQIFAIYSHAAYAQEDFNSAKKEAERALEINPHNAYAKTILIKLATRDGHYEIAESFGLEVLKDSPEYSLGHANLGDVYFVQGRYELAEIEYDQTKLLMNSETKGSRLRNARMKFMKEEYKDAAEILEKLIEAYHTYYDDAMCDLLLCYEKMGEEDKKQDLLEKMELRRDFYKRTENLLREFGNN